MEPQQGVYRVSRDQNQNSDSESESENVAPTLTRTLFLSSSPSRPHSPMKTSRMMNAGTTRTGNILFPSETLSQESTETFITEANDHDDDHDDDSFGTCTMETTPLSLPKAVPTSSRFAASSPPPSDRMARKRTSSDLLKKRAPKPTLNMPNMPIPGTHTCMDSNTATTTTLEHMPFNANCTSYVPPPSTRKDMGASRGFFRASLESIQSFDSHDSNHSVASGSHAPPPSTVKQSLFGDDWLHGRSSFTGSPIEEANPNQSLDLSMEDDDDDHHLTKIRKLNLGDDMEEDFLPTTNTRTMKPSSINPFKLFTSPDGDDPKDDSISPNDVMASQFASMPQKVASPPTFDFSSDAVFSPPAPLKKGPNMTATTDYYGNSHTMSHGHGQMPKTPMLERKAPRRMRHYGEENDAGPGPSTIIHEEKSRFNEDFEIIGTLGDGSFGTVYKCKSRLDGCTYAVKVAKRCAKGKADRDQMLQEVKALAVLSDVSDMAAFHIVRYHQAWIEENTLHIVTDLCTSTLQDEMKSGLLKNNTERHYQLLREMLLALKLIHQHGKVHLDIKPENIFVKDQLFKLGDFGLVIDDTTVGEVEEGDCRYMCMDLLSGNHRDLTKCDIFSLGITMYEIILDRALPADGQEWQDLRAGRLAPMPSTPVELQNLIMEMMHKDGKLRPTAAELLTRRQLLSGDQKELIFQQNKARQAQEAWKAMAKKLSPPKRLLVRSNTCPGLG